MYVRHIHIRTYIHAHSYSVCVYQIYDSRSCPCNLFNEVSWCNVWVLVCIGAQSCVCVCVCVGGWVGMCLAKDNSHVDA